MKLRCQGALTLFVAVLLVGCAGQLAPLGSDREMDAPGAEAEIVPCNGNDPENFCDDCNPCTIDLNCTPCSALGAVERDIYHCTPDAELAPACAGQTGCLHVAVTSPAHDTNACFPVVDATPHAGVCRAGRCQDDPD